MLREIAVLTLYGTVLILTLTPNLTMTLTLILTIGLRHCVLLCLLQNIAPQYIIGLSKYCEHCDQPNSLE